MKIDGLTKDQGPSPVQHQAIEIIKRYLEETRVTMGDGTQSTKLCLLCTDKFIPALQSAHNCVCNQARELLSGHLK